MGKFIYLGEFSYQSLYLLYFIIVDFCLGVTKTYIGQNGKMFSNRSLLYTFIMFFSESLILIVYFIFKRNKNDKSLSIQKQPDKERPIKIKKYSQFQTGMFIIFLILIDLTSTFCGQLFVFEGVKSLIISLK